MIIKVYKARIIKFWNVIKIVQYIIFNKAHTKCCKFVIKYTLICIGLLCIVAKWSFVWIFVQASRRLEECTWISRVTILKFFYPAAQNVAKTCLNLVSLLNTDCTSTTNIKCVFMLLIKFFCIEFHIGWMIF